MTDEAMSDAIVAAGVLRRFFTGSEYSVLSETSASGEPYLCIDGTLTLSTPEFEAVTRFLGDVKPYEDRLDDDDD